MLSDFLLSGITISVNDADGNQTGNGVTFPGYQSTILSIDDIKAALGGDAIEGSENYLVNDTGSSIEFYNYGTAYGSISAEYNSETGLLTQIRINYDSDRLLAGVSQSGGGISVDDTAYLTDVFATTISSLNSSSYVGFAGYSGFASTMFVAEDMSMIDFSSMTAYDAAVYGASGTAGEGTLMGTIHSSSEDGKPIKANGDYIYCASNQAVAKIRIDYSSNGLVLVDKYCYETDSDGSVRYYHQDSDGTKTDMSDSLLFDNLMSEYDSATAVAFSLK
jgi:hypothetical protein